MYIGIASVLATPQNLSHTYITINSVTSRSVTSRQKNLLSDFSSL
jgi:hypothetical protein